MDPVLPESFGDLHLSNAPLGGGRITIDIVGSVPSINGLPADMVFHRGTRPWMSELVAEALRRRANAQQQADTPQ